MGVIFQNGFGIGTTPISISNIYNQIKIIYKEV
jgi:hypothetical protein